MHWLSLSTTYSRMLQAGSPEHQLVELSCDQWIPLWNPSQTLRQSGPAETGSHRSQTCPQRNLLSGSPSTNKGIVDVPFLVDTLKRDVGPADLKWRTGLIRLSRILSFTKHDKPQIPKLSRANCVTIQLTVRAWSHEPGKQCAWAVCYSLSCFSLGSFAGPPGKRDYLENFHPGSRHHYTGIPANRAGSVVM